MSRQGQRLAGILARLSSRSCSAWGSEGACVTLNLSSTHASQATTQAHFERALVGTKQDSLLPPCLAGISTSAKVSAEPLKGGDLYASAIQYPPMEAKVGEPAPRFSVGAVVDGEIKQVSLDDYQGKYVVLFFYPKDFTFVCPTEIIAFSDHAKEFEKLNCAVLAASTDTEESHLAWIRTPRNRGGLGHMQIPILADVTKEISARYGVLIPKIGIALRGLFIISPEGLIKQMTINDLPIGRSVDETLRLLQAIQYHAEHGEVCPAGWKPGDKAMIADPDKSQDYFSQAYKQSEEDVIGQKLTPVKTKADYEKLTRADKPVVVDFYAPWCGKCRSIAPFLDQMVDKYPGITIAKVDTSDDQHQIWTADAGIKTIPHFRFFKGGKEVCEPITGYKKQPVEDNINKMLKM